jgi:hypothetical protein
MVTFASPDDRFMLATPIENSVRKHPKLDILALAACLLSSGINAAG